jgi:hypothetical protein
MFATAGLEYFKCQAICLPNAEAQQQQQNQIHVICFKNSSSDTGVQIVYIIGICSYSYSPSIVKQTKMHPRRKKNIIELRALFLLSAFLQKR